MGLDARGAEGKDYSCLNAFPSLVAELMSLQMKTQFVHACLRTVLILAALTELFVVQLWFIQSKKKKDKRFERPILTKKLSRPSISGNVPGIIEIDHRTDGS